MAIGAFFGVKDSDFQRADWYLFNEEKFNEFPAGTFKKTYPQYTNRSDQCYLCDDSPRYFIDASSQQLYLHRRERDIQDRFCFIAALMPLAGLVAAIAYIAFSIFKVFTFYAFIDNKNASLADRAKLWGIDCLRLLATPLSLIMAQGLAIYGMIHPKDGMKAWTTFGQVALGFKREFFFNPFIYKGASDGHLLDHRVKDLVLGDFCPWNRWEKDSSEHVFGNGECTECPKHTPQMVRDMTTGRLYFNDPPSVLRLKGIGMFLFSAILHPTTLICNIAFRLFKIMTFYHFWRGIFEEDEFGAKKPYGLQGRLQHFVGDCLRIGLAPALLAGLFLSAIYMLIMPKDGKKLYATLVQAEYGRPILEPCLHPGYNAGHRHYTTADEFLNR